MTNQPLNPVRNYGVDLLRVLSMFYVLVLHVLGRGGVLAAAPPGTAAAHTAWFCEIWAYGAVDIFGLISGYVAYREKPRPVRLAGFASLWLQAVFYGVAVTLLALLFVPQTVGQNELTTMLFPVSNGLYWYLTAYLGLTVCMPLLNAGLRACPAATAKKLFYALFTVFSVYECFFRRFHLQNGYSFVWLALLYLLGGLAKKANIGGALRVWQAALGIVSCVLVAFLWRQFGVEFSLGATVVRRDFLVSYTSPAVLGASLLHLIAFSKLRFSPAACKLIRFGASGAFAAYLLNCQRWIWTHWLTGRYAFLAACSPPVLAAATLCAALAFLVFALLADALRRGLFTLLWVEQGLNRLEAALRRLFTDKGGNKA